MAAFRTASCVLALLAVTSAAPLRSTAPTATLKETEAPAIVRSNSDVGIGVPSSGFFLLLEKLTGTIRAGIEGLRQLSANVKDLSSNVKRLSVTFKQSSKAPTQNLSKLSTPDPRRASGSTRRACPWTYFTGMCLMLSKERAHWAEANRTCESRGSHLVWLESKLQHQFVNWFVKAHASEFEYYHIGLSRPAPGASFTWTSGSRSSYRGEPFKVHENGTQVVAYAASRMFFGDPPNLSKWKFVCRRL